MKLLNLAAKIAASSRSPLIKKDYLLAAIVKRKDGALVSSTNGLTVTPQPSAHAEARVLRMADFGATLYVVRILRNGEWAMAKPCSKCQAYIRSKGIVRVYYSIGKDEYGVWDVSKTKNP